MRKIGLTIFLYPISLIYGLVVSIRHLFFKWGILKSRSYPIPIICVGNLSVGGTGKTPMVEMLIRLLEKDYKIAVISRGYKRKTKGLFLANSNSTAEEIGDEPKQIVENYPQITMLVDANRRRAIDFLLTKNEKPDIILLDDGFQHRYVSPTFSILLTAWDKPYIKDKLLPLGRLREAKRESKRADCVIVTRTPYSCTPMDIRFFERKLSLLPHQKLFFAESCSGDLQAVFSLEKGEVFLPSSSVIAIVGIAHPEPFIKELSSKWELQESLIYSDHYSFSRKDWKIWEEKSKEYPNAFFCMTQKDAVRLKEKASELSEELKSRMFYIPIETVLRNNAESQLKELVEKIIKKTKRDYRI